MFNKEYIKAETEKVLKESLKFFKNQIYKKSRGVDEKQIYYTLKYKYDGDKLICLWEYSTIYRWIKNEKFYDVLKRVEEIFNSLEEYEAKSYIEDSQYCLDITLTKIEEIK